MLNLPDDVKSDDEHAQWKFSTGSVAPLGEMSSTDSDISDDVDGGLSAAEIDQTSFQLMLRRSDADYLPLRSVELIEIPGHPSTFALEIVGGTGSAERVAVERAGVKGWEVTPTPTLTSHLSERAAEMEYLGFDVLATASDSVCYWDSISRKRSSEWEPLSPYAFRQIGDDLFFLNHRGAATGKDYYIMKLRGALLTSREIVLDVDDRSDIIQLIGDFHILSRERELETQVLWGMSPAELRFNRLQWNHSRDVLLRFECGRDACAEWNDRYVKFHQGISDGLPVADVPPVEVSRIRRVILDGKTARWNDPEHVDEVFQEWRNDVDMDDVIPQMSSESRVVRF